MTTISENVNQLNKFREACEKSKIGNKDECVEMLVLMDVVDGLERINTHLKDIEHKISEMG